MGSCVSVSSFRRASHRVPLLPMQRDETQQPQDTVTTGGRGDIRGEGGDGQKQREGRQRDGGSAQALVLKQAHERLQREEEKERQPAGGGKTKGKLLLKCYMTCYNRAAAAAECVNIQFVLLLQLSLYVHHVWSPPSCLPINVPTDSRTVCGCHFL
ncbi:hypothetical protein PAMP_016599 [Pampus punctatissimus]